jgi:hypothetical protein
MEIRPFRPASPRPCRTHTQGARGERERVRGREREREREGEGWAGGEGEEPVEAEDSSIFAIPLWPSLINRRF